MALAPRVAGLHRNLGDGYYRLGLNAEARAAYSRAIELMEEQLRINPRQASLLATLAFCEARLDRTDLAAQHAAEAVALSPDDRNIRYNKAVVAALGGRTEEALRELEEALRVGFSADAAARDSDLAALHGLPGFRTLVGEAPERR